MPTATPTIPILRCRTMGAAPRQAHGRLGASGSVEGGCAKGQLPPGLRSLQGDWGGTVVDRSSIQVLLIGGPPGAGKTTLGTALANRLGITSLSVDDLVVAAKAVTTPDTHPGLWALARAPVHEYFTDSSVERLVADATQRHEATWPMVEAVIRKHASTGGTPIVIDGWHLRPSQVAALSLDNVWSGWLAPAPEVLEQRERAFGFHAGSADPERMLANFLARSHWHNRLIAEQATGFGMALLRQPGNVSVDDLCDRILDDLGPRLPQPMLP